MEPSQLTEDQAAGMLVMGACCCFVAVVGFIGLFVWLLRRGSSTTAAPQPPPAPAPPASAPAPQPSAPHQHLSVLAIAFDTFFKDQVQAVLLAPSAATDAFGQRVELVQRVARALLGLEPQWRFFGYGDKDLPAEAETQSSYLSALEDFRTRSAQPGDGGRLVVLTLVIATRSHLLGVDRLDQRAQVRAMLEDRGRLEPGNLLGADVVWGPSDGGLTETALLQRFPEVHALVG